MVYYIQRNAILSCMVIRSLPSDLSFFIKDYVFYMAAKRKVTFHIDGFNFYYGLKKQMDKYPAWKKYYWIDMVKLCEQFIGPEQEVYKVYYYTASPLNTAKSSRQSAFLNANKLLNPERFEIIRGKYLEKHYECPNCHGDISRPEEKKTDVNISVGMIKNCITNEADDITLISADTDLLPPLELIRELYPNKVLKVIFPPAHYSYDITNTISAWHKKPVLMKNNKEKFDKAVMPNNVTVGNVTVQIPESWK